MQEDNLFAARALKFMRTVIAARQLLLQQRLYMAISHPDCDVVVYVAPASSDVTSGVCAATLTHRCLSPPTRCFPQYTSGYEAQ